MSLDTIAQKSDLTPEQLSIVQSELDGRKKNPVVTWLLWLFLSSFGAHHFYLGNKGAGIGYLALNFLGWLTCWIIIGFFFWGALGIWWIIDAFILNKKIEEVNKRLEEDIITKVKAYSNRTQAE